MAFHRTFADEQNKVYGSLCSYDSRNRFIQITYRSQQTGAKVNRVIKCLIQLHIAQEETKFGFSAEECREMLAAGEWKHLDNVQICGLMGMASNTDDTEQIDREFCSLNKLFKELKETYFPESDNFCELSMGCRTTIIRLLPKGVH